MKPADAGPCPQPYCPETIYDRTIDANPRRGVEVDDKDIYWCEGSSIDGMVVRAAPKDGSGPIRTLGEWYDFAFNRSLVVDDTHVYWLRPHASGTPALVDLVRVDKDGSGERAVVVPALPADVKLLDMGALAGTQDALLVATFSCSWIIRVPKDGSTAQLWQVSPYDDAGGATGLELLGSFIYCSNGHYIHRLDPLTGTVTEVANGQNHAGPMVMIDGSLYFSNNGGGAGDPENLALVGPNGDPSQSVGSSFGSTGRLLHDEPRHTIYWVTGLSPFFGNVVAYDVSGTAPPQRLLEGQNVTGDSAADADYLYWLSEHAVTRLRKWP